MIIYLFNEETYHTINLPQKVSGMFPIYIKNKMVANVISEQGEWFIQLSNDYISKELYLTKTKLTPHKIYEFTSKSTRKRFFLIATPKYDTNTKIYNLNTNSFIIGSNINCGIYYPLEFNHEDFLKLNFINGKWVTETNSSNFFISDNRAKSGQKILNGDYIFYFGLKIILIGSRIIINNPNNSIKIEKGLLIPQQSPNALLTQAEIEEIISKSHDVPPPLSKENYFYKSPRFDFVIQEAKVEIDEPPEPIKDEDLPAILTIGPQITMAGASVLSMMGIFFIYTSNNINIAYIIISISSTLLFAAGIVLWPTITRKFNHAKNKKKEKKRQERYKQYLTQKNNTIEEIKASQRQTILNNNPAPIDCVRIIKSKSPKLWQRNINHEDFLTVRLGLGTIKTKININLPQEHFSINDEDTLFTMMKQIVNDSLHIPNTPVTYSFVNQKIDAIVGDPEVIKPFMDFLFLQILTFHSYTDLKIVVFTKEPKKWDYLKVVPHCWDSQKSIRYFATSMEQLSVICSDLEKIFDARAINSEEVKLEDDGSKQNSETDFKDYRPYYLFFIDDMTSVRNVSLIKKILHYKRNLGFSIITVTQSISTLPSETSDFIGVSTTNSAIMVSETQTSSTPFAADLNINNAIDIHDCAQSLANIPVMLEKDKFELPKSISFLELYNCGRVEHLNSSSRWSTNNPTISLSVPIGIDQNGEIFEMDIHEKAYGPHGLVAGTTGSGKSEWIITFLLSLAVNFSPEEVQFVLIDYKGGGLAKSFENAELNIKLPHLAGTITNLDKSEIFRSIAAIESELKRRQAIFNDTREKLKKGSIDIYDYQQYYRQGLVDEPLSHLLIVCDEFAELKQQQPDFMEQLISTSRIGRSLGVHLILCTQKPNGIVNDQIWSNSKFKVCLKVQDQSDSREILKKSDAAFLKQAGSFYLQVGNDDYYNLGQAAWTGSDYYPSDITVSKVDDSMQLLDDIGRVINSYKGKEEVKKSQGEELLNIVSYLTETSKQLSTNNRQLWLENVNPKMLLSELYKKYPKPPIEKFTYKTIIGEYDEPRKQEQGLLSIDLNNGNIAIINQDNSSAEKLLSTIIWSSICDHTPAEIAYYIIDFGTETLKKFANFPQVGEVVSQNELDKVTGVLNLIFEEIKRRKKELITANGSIEYYNKTHTEKIGLIVVVINNIDSLNELLPSTDDLISSLFRDAFKYGVVFIVSASTTSAIGYRKIQFFRHIIPLQLSDDSDYRIITDCRRGLIPKKVVGRGICKINIKDTDSYCEFQTAMIDTEEHELNTIKSYAEKCVEYYKCKVKQLTKIPNDMTSDDLANFVSNLSNVPIGRALHEKIIFNYNFLNQKVHLFTGKDLDEQMGFIYGLSSILSKVPNTKIRVIDMLGIFKKPILDIKFFNSDIDNVVAALEKDVINRTEAQDFGVNIIIGAGQYKNVLANVSIETFQSIFTNLPNGKNNLYILIDDYDKLRSLKLETWFNQSYLNNGLWLGTSFTNQSLFPVKTVNEEDKKYDYKGLAFHIDKQNYKVIKTLIDSEE